MVFYELKQDLREYLEQFSFNSPKEFNQRVEEVTGKKEEILNKIGSVMKPYMQGRSLTDPKFKYYNPILCDIVAANLERDNVNFLKSITGLAIKLREE